MEPPISIGPRGAVGAAIMTNMMVSDACPKQEGPELENALNSGMHFNKSLYDVRTIPQSSHISMSLYIHIYLSINLSIYLHPFDLRILL